MRKPYRLLGLGLLVGLSLLAGCGGGGGGKSSTPTRVGSATCTNACHANTKDITGTQIAAAWANTTHTTVDNVQCEDCHGAGSLHMGVGNIPFPNPQAAQCNANGCHDKKGFDSTMHANSEPYNGTNINTFTGPDKFFFQGDALNSGIAEIKSKPEFFPDGVTPVTHALHIEECSRCHNPNQRFEYSNADRSGALVTPNPVNMPDPPNITCAGCHDGHQSEAMVKIAQRNKPVAYPVFRKFFVNPTGEQNDNVPGTQMAASIYQPNGAVQADGSVDPSKVVGKNNELNTERLCASCHTKGKYKYSQLATHQNDVYTEWKDSGHGNRNTPPFAEFSANPLAYTNPYHPDTPYDTGHAPSYPIDMSLSKFGTTADTTQNAGNNVYACFQCHNGLGSLVYQEGTQGTSKADVIFGDEPVVCITCHDTHGSPAGSTHQVRLPDYIVNYSSTPSVKDPVTGETVTAPTITIKGRYFLDKQPVPVDRTATGTICVFCHQGRQSGYTLYKSKIEPAATLNPAFLTGNFFNPHYLGTAAMLWGANAYEYAGKSYSVVLQHQGANCPTCHMTNTDDVAKVGGHTWKPNVKTCNTSLCHASLGQVGVKAGTAAAPDVDNYRVNNDANNYTGETGGASLSIANSIRVLQQKLITALAARGVYYDDTANPYFFADTTHKTNFTAWTPSLYKAAFNLAFTVKGLPAVGISQANVPNASAAVHNYKYTIQLLQDSYQDLTGAALPGAVRPAGMRPATVYGPAQ